MPFYAENDSFNRNCIGAQLRFTWLPTKCWASGKMLWLQFAYRRVAMWTGPGDPVFEYRWYHKDEYIIAKLKGSV